MNSQIETFQKNTHVSKRREQNRHTMWFKSTKEIAEQYGQIHTFDQVLQLSNEEWKKIWKGTIWKKDEISIREKAKGMTKMRTVEATS
jgi:hypothetical protein